MNRTVGRNAKSTGIDDEPKVVSGEVVCVTKDADIEAGLAEMGLACLIWTARTQAAEVKHAEEVVVFAGDDEDGSREGAELAAWVRARTSAPVSLVVLDGFEKSSRNLRTWAAAGNDIGKLIAKARHDADAKNGRQSDRRDPGAGGAKGEAQGAAESCARALLRLAEDAVLFHSPDGRYYADVQFNGHRQTHEIRSSGFRQWLTRLFYLDRGTPPTAEGLQGAIGVLEARARFDGECHPVNLRVAGDDATIYLDLGDESWRAVKITPGEWRIVDQPAARFRRPKGMLPLPVPEKGGSAELLATFVNIRPEEFDLFLAWLCAAMRPAGPYPVLHISGVHGSAKSTITLVARRLIDAYASPMRSPSKEPRELAIAAHNNWVVALNNVSAIADWLSDGLCCLSTGGGYASRTLYSDSEETVHEASRPVIINSIAEAADRGDLVDRCVFLNPPEIPADRRREEREFWRKFEESKSKLFGFLLDTLAAALRELPNVQLTEKPRMADFAAFGEAVCRGLGMPAGTFAGSYQANRQLANDAALEDSAIAGAVARLLEGRAEGSWSGTAAELVDALSAVVDPKIAASKGWPKTPRKMSGDFRRVVPQLRLAGYRVEFEHGRRRTITITPPAPEEQRETPSQPSQPSPTLENKGKSCDGTNLQPSHTVAQPSSSPSPSTIREVACDGLATVDDGMKNQPSSLAPYKTRALDGIDGCDGLSRQYSGVGQSEYVAIDWRNPDPRPF